MQTAAIRTSEINPAKLTRLYVEQFNLSAVKKGETIAVVSDLGTRREYVQSAFAAAEELGADIYELCVNSLPGWTRPSLRSTSISRTRFRYFDMSMMIEVLQH